MSKKPRILIAGIAGASLGTEIAKSLHHAGSYDILGCDISPLAFGHFDQHFCATFIVNRDCYVQDLISLCSDQKIDCIIPGGDEPAVLIGAATKSFANAKIKVGQNDPDLVSRISHKGDCFKHLAEIGIRVPITKTVEELADIDAIPIPCVVKPANASGGSAYVFFAADRGEARLYCSYLRNNGRIPVVQEYLSEQGGEYTVGVLSTPDGSCAGSIALKRSFSSKLSVAARGNGFLISSGYSQGQIDEFPEICATAEQIAKRLGSKGPLNIQGRLSGDGAFVPFEINPRFSASTFLRTLAGFNEVDCLTRILLGLKPVAELGIRPGWYLRTLSEVAVPPTRGPK